MNLSRQNQSENYENLSILPLFIISALYRPHYEYIQIVLGYSSCPFDFDADGIMVRVVHSLVLLLPSSAVLCVYSTVSSDWSAYSSPQTRSRIPHSLLIINPSPAPSKFSKLFVSFPHLIVYMVIFKKKEENNLAIDFSTFYLMK